MTLLHHSDIVSGFQCSKRLYLSRTQPEIAAPPPSMVKALHKDRIEATRIAHALFGPKQTLTGSPDERSRECLDLLQSSKPVFLRGACLKTSTLLLEPDLLRCTPEGQWEIFLVRVALRVKRGAIDELGLQVHALHELGIQPARAVILHLDPDYRHQSLLDPADLFVSTDVLPYLGQTLEITARLVADLSETLKAPHPPDVVPGRHCKDPQPCPFQAHCNPPLHPFHIQRIPHASRLEQKLQRTGVNDVRDLPSPLRLSTLQRRAIDCLRNQKDWIGPDLESELEDVEFPLGFLDFEAIQPALPRYPGTHPHQSLPTQWSLHVLQANGTLEHREFLHELDTDPRDRFVQSLLEAVEDVGSMVVYSSYEAAVLRRLAEHLPHKAQAIAKVIFRLHDLLAVIRRHYYHPAFNGSFSIKRVLPALVPHLSYDDLDIRDGATAALSQPLLVHPDTCDKERSALRNALLRYCERDTQAMICIRDALLKRCEDQHLNSTTVEEW